MPDGSTRSRAERIARVLLGNVKVALAGAVDGDYFDGWVSAYFDAVVDVVQTELVPLLPPVTEPRSSSPVTRAHGRRGSSTSPVEGAPVFRGRIVDGTLLDVDDRAEANLAAMRILARVQWGTADERADLLNLTDADRAAINLYSGWGGIGLKKYADRFPRGFPVPEARGLVHEYYTPRRIWRAIVEQLVKPVLADLPRVEGRVRALEPSAGIGRALSVCDGMPLDWTALEASAVSAKLLRAVYPRARVVEGYAEDWFARNPGERFGLVLANPPYGPRGEGKELDPLGYATKQAYIYFVVRAAERLAAGGIGIYIIPTGFMTSRSAPFVKHRTALLERAHLLGAWRLPSVPPPGGSLDDVAYEQFVVDVVMVRGRGGIASALPPSDLGVVEGDYYETHPAHVLGRVLTNDGEDADEPPRGKVRRGMQVEGRFTGFPAWTPRPMVEVAVSARVEKGGARGGIARATASGLPDDAPVRLQSAINIGMRLDRYLAAVAAGKDTETMGRVELVNDLTAWGVAHGAPARDEGLRTLAAGGNVAASRFLAVWSGSALIPAMYERSKPPAYTGARSLPDLADWMFRQGGGLPLALSKLDKAAREAGLGPVPLTRVWSDLFAGGWRVDGADPDYTIEPRGHYLSGFLWPKFDNAEYLRGDEAAVQLSELREAIGWVGGSALFGSIVPNQPWIPLTLLARFATEAKVVVKVNDKAKLVPAVDKWPGKAVLVRDEGLVRFDGVPYSALENTKEGRDRTGASQDTLCFLGYLNTDNTLWKPPIEKELDENGKEVQVPIEVTRKRQELRWRDAFNKWIQTNPDVAEALERAYNRTLRGYRPFEYPSDPVEIARWAPGITLHPWQNAGLRKLVDNRSGLLAFDVGLGKTFTGIALVAKARQDGWAKRPVVIVPPTICWKWYRDFAKALPDYRVVVIGSDRRKATSGKRAGKWVAVNDTPETRAEKWTAFQAGAYDVAIITYSALSRQQVDAAFVADYVGKTVAIRRAIQLSLEQADKAADAKGEDKKKAKRTERSEADIQERVRAWVGEKLAPPKNWRYDVGIDWHALGIDLAVVDEGQNFKNLFFSEREGAGEKAAAKRAWALDFRMASVRAHAGGAGVVILSATPMKNAATEFYNLLYLVNPKIWEQVGVTDPESFISQFAAIAPRKVTGGDGKQKEMDVVVGFHHVDALKGVVYRWADFKTAQQVGLKLPDVHRTQHVARPSEEQIDKFGELYAELADIADKMKNVAHMKDAKGEAVKRALRLKKQGVNMRLYLAALHPGLVDGSNVPEAGPKLVQCVEAIVATKPATCSTDDDGNEWCLDCGHIVFCENPRVHDHLRTLLVREGLDPKRIAILNADEAPDLEQRQQIAEGFNGVGKPTDEEYAPPIYDVVIANAVAYEGIDLQVRTCAIHHLDVPFEPATLQQRNGRGVRQGAKFTAIGIHFYFVAGSSEQHRLDKIERKRGIMLALYEDADLATNTVQADEVEAEDDVADSFLAFAPPEVAEKIRAMQADEAAEKKRNAEQAARKLANGVLADAVAARRRWVRATEAGAENAADLGDEFRRLELRLSTFPAALWPGQWHELAKLAVAHADERGVYIPDEGYPMIPGVFLTYRLGEKVAEDWSMLVTSAGDEGAFGVPNRSYAELATLPGYAEDGYHPAVVVREVPPSEFYQRWSSYVPWHGIHSWSGEQWRAHGPEWQRVIWPRWVEQIKKYQGGDAFYIPDVGPAVAGYETGTLRLVSRSSVRVADLYPATPEGYEAMMKAAANQREVQHRKLAASVRWWWGVDLPVGTVGRALNKESA